MTVIPITLDSAAAVDWRESALCAQTDPESFFPEKGGSVRAAKRTCAACPVKPECLNWSLETREPNGIWGGLSERERRRIWQGNAPDPRQVPEPDQEDAA